MELAIGRSERSMCRHATSSRFIESDLLVLEYEQLKEEQRQRIAGRDNLIYATLVAVGAVGAAAIQTNVVMLLLLPPVCLILGWTYASNDRKVWQIGRYIRRTLATHLADRAPQAEPFGWEAEHRHVLGYRRHRTIQAGVTMVTFCGPGLGAFVINWSRAVSSPYLMALIVTEAAALGAFGYHLLTNVDRHTDPAAEPEGADQPNI
jgi:hypothetical protein